jgi:hypothetical protein
VDNQTVGMMQLRERPVRGAVVKVLVRRRWTLLAATTWSLLIMITSIGVIQPVDRDEGAFLVIAREILRGQIPYRDVFDHKAPAIYYVLAGVLALTGHFNPVTQLIVARLVAMAMAVVTAVGLVSIGRRWWGADAGKIAAVLWLVALPTFGGNQIFTEPFATAAAVWSVCVVLRWPGTRGALVAGFLVALGSLFKQTALLALPGVAAALLVNGESLGFVWRPLRGTMARLCALAIGMVSPWVVVGAIFAWAGALTPLLSQVLVANLVHYPPDSADVTLSDLQLQITQVALLWSMPMLMISGSLVLRLVGRAPFQFKPSARVLTTAMLASLNLLPLLSHTYPHYWLQGLPWLALLVGAVEAWSTVRSGRGHLNNPHRAMLLASALFAIMIVMSSILWIEALPHRYGYLQDQVNVGAWIATHTPADARLLVAPAEPEYYYFAGRLPVTPFVYLLQINASNELLSQVTAEISAERFDVIVWRQDPYPPMSTAYDARIAGMQQTLRAHYHEVKTDGPLGLMVFMADSPGG